MAEICGTSLHGGVAMNKIQYDIYIHMVHNMEVSQHQPDTGQFHHLILGFILNYTYIIMLL